MALLLAFPIVAFLAMLQVGVISRLQLLYGSGDIVMLAIIAWALHERVKTAWFWTLLAGGVISLVSGLPSLTPLWGYLIVTAIAQILRRRVWQTPFLAMLLVTFLGTLITMGLDWLVLQFQTGAYPLQTSLNLVIMPSALLNLIFALPVYALVNDLADTLYPDQNTL